MFRKNDRHRRQEPARPPTPLPEKQRRRLEESWAGSFYREFFCRLDEGPFAVLYSTAPSRPNAPVNVLVGAEVLKAGFGWSDAELADALQFNLQVRYALGLREWDEGDFVLRTLYNFRRRLVQHMQATGENLWEHVFEQVTDEQIAAWQLNTTVQRMDSTLVASNIRTTSRLQLLVEVVQRVHRMLTEADQRQEAAALAPYLKGSSGQYCYHLHGEEFPTHLERIGVLMQRLVRELAAAYGAEPVYQILCRVFREHFTEGSGAAPPPTASGAAPPPTASGAAPPPTASGAAPPPTASGAAPPPTESGAAPPPTGDSAVAVTVKAAAEVSSQSLQSPDDLEATYRNKGGLKQRGYVLNLTETCTPANQFQLITKVQVAPNNTDDGVLLREALPNLHARTGLRQLWNDGNYTGPEVEPTLRQYGVEQLLTAIRGARPETSRLALAAFSWEVNAAEEPQAVTCPGGQRVEVRAGRVPNRCYAHFDGVHCASCALAPRCRAQPGQRTPAWVLRLELRDVAVARRRQVVTQVQHLGYNLRAAVEATVRSCKHPSGGKVPVRGQKRVTMVCLATALLVNARRIWRYQVAQREAQEPAGAVFLLFRVLKWFGRWLHQLWPHQANSWTVQPVYG